MTKSAPTHHLASRPVELGIVLLEPGVTKDQGSLRGQDNKKLKSLMVVSRHNLFQGVRLVSNAGKVMAVQGICV